MPTSAEFESNTGYEPSAVLAAQPTGLDNFRQTVFGPTENDGIDNRGVFKSLTGDSEGAAMGARSHVPAGSGESSIGNLLEITPISSVTGQTPSNGGDMLSSGIEDHAANRNLGDSGQTASFPIASVAQNPAVTREGEAMSAMAAKGASDNLFAVRSEAAESPEQRLNRRMTEVFGADVMEHLNADGAEWLRDNAQKIADGFAKVSGREAWDMACAMRDRTRLPNGNHVIFLSRQDGPTYGDLIPKRHDVYVRRYHFYQGDTRVGQVYPR